MCGIVAMVQLDGAPVDLGPEEIEVVVEANEGFAAAGGRAGVVVLHTALTDELRQQLLQTYFQGLKDGVQGITPEDLDGVREMVRDLNALLEKHASGADTADDFAAFMAAHDRFFPP